MKIHQATHHKINQKHAVTKTEAEQAFDNPIGNIYEDNRPEHHSVPPKQWFIGETLYGRKIKIVFIEQLDGQIILVSAYEPSEETKDFYKRLNQRDGLEIDI